MTKVSLLLESWLLNNKKEHEYEKRWNKAHLVPKKQSVRIYMGHVQDSFFIFTISIPRQLFNATFLNLSYTRKNARITSNKQQSNQTYDTFRKQ